MTPYILLQDSLYLALVHLKHHEPKKLREMLECFRTYDDCDYYLKLEDVSFLESGSLCIPAVYEIDTETMHRDIIEITLELCKRTIGDELVIDKVWGQKFRTPCVPLGMPDYHKKVENDPEVALRTEHIAQPRALRVGDVLATGCRVTQEPREGGNGAVCIELGGKDWKYLPAHIPIGLQTPANTQ